jgi:hypothetical protein
MTGDEDGDPTARIRCNFCRTLSAAFQPTLQLH